MCKHGKGKLDFHSYHDLSSDEESNSRGSEGSCEDVSFGSDDDEVLVNVDISGIPVQSWLREPVEQDNSGNLPAVDEGDKHGNSIGNIDCGVPFTWTINII